MYLTKKNENINAIAQPKFNFLTNQTRTFIYKSNSSFNIFGSTQFHPNHKL